MTTMTGDFTTPKLYRITAPEGGEFHGHNGAYLLEEQGSGRSGFIDLSRMLLSTRIILSRSELCTDVVLKGRPVIEHDDGSVVVEELEWGKDDRCGFEKGEEIEAYLVGLKCHVDGPVGGLFRARSHPQHLLVPLESYLGDGLREFLAWDDVQHLPVHKEDLFDHFGHMASIEILEAHFAARRSSYHHRVPEACEFES